MRIHFVQVFSSVSFQVAPFEQLEELERLVDVEPNRPRPASPVEEEVAAQQDEEDATGNIPSGNAAARILAHAKVLRDSL